MFVCVLLLCDRAGLCVSEWVEEGGGQQTAKYAYGLSGRLRS